MKTRHRIRALSGEKIQALRRQLGEDTETFGQRFDRSGRTVEDWEQGRRTPDPLVSRMMRALVDWRDQDLVAVVARR